VFPSIVFGLFGVGFFIQFVAGDRQPFLVGTPLCSPPSSGCGDDGMLTLPVMIVATEEALRAIQPGLREGSLALGRPSWRQSFESSCTSSAGHPDGVICRGRGAGEVAPIMFTGAAYYSPSAGQ